MKRVEHRACAGGWQDVYQHDSSTLDCSMRFAAFMPPQSRRRRLPVLYWLGGEGCTEQDFITRAGAQQRAAELGVILVAPDTRPRGTGIVETDAGRHSGFYLNATRAPWSRHYRMYDYVSRELPALLESELPISEEARAISGHGMGGHGALVIGLSNPERYRSISAFAPIVTPAQVPWCEQVFKNYLGDDRHAWQSYDPCELITRMRKHLPLLIDQGVADPQLDTHLRPHQLQRAARAGAYAMSLRMHEGYDHSYYFVASFINEHLDHHAAALL